MKKRNLAISIMSFVFALAVGLFALTASQGSKVTYAEANISVEYRESYTVGETVEIQSAEFEYQGKYYPANVLVRFPNGNTYRYDEILLEEAGIYTIEYSAFADNNVLLKETKSFTVFADTYSFSGEGSYTYGTNDYLGENVQGLNVALGRNSTFTINTPIDVSNLTKNDSIIKFYATPDIKGSSEVGWLYVRLTDVHNPDVYVEWMYQPVGTFQYVYGAANGQFVTGLRQYSTPLSEYVEYDGYYYKLSHNSTSKVGHVTRASLTGTMDANNTEKLVSRYFPNNTPYTEEELFYYNSLEVRMDYGQKRLYSQPDGVYSISRAIVADFDDERALDGRDPWEGFTTGEAVLSIYAKEYTVSNFNFFITDIYGQELTHDTAKNTIAPRLTVDTDKYESDNLPNAIVGKKFPLFNAVAEDDVDGKVDVSVKIYNSIGATFSVVDNAFIPTRKGTYTIEYSAVDSFGNKSVKSFTVDAINREKLEYEFSVAETEFSAGEEVQVKAITLLNPANHHTLKISAKNLEQGVEYSIDNDTLTFVPLYAGRYVITYTYNDYCTEETDSYEITVGQSNLVVFDDNILLPKYIIKGLEYPVVEMYGYTFTNGTERLLTKLSIREGDGEPRPVSGNTYSVQGSVDSMAFVYELNGVRKIYERPVVDAVSRSGQSYVVDYSKYFYPAVGAFEASAKEDKINFKVKSAEDGAAKLEVINPARLFNNFEVNFGVETGATNFTGINVVFTSAYDESKTIRWQFTRAEGNTVKVRVANSSFTAEGQLTSQFKTDDEFKITYNSGTQSFKVGAFTVDANKLWEGFDEQFYISFELYGISGPAGICISKVVNQKISKYTTDNTRPVALYDSLKKYYVVGDELIINKINVYDFVDPNPSCVATLKRGNTILTSVDGVRLDGVENRIDRTYTVKVDKVENMSFVVSYRDFAATRATSDGNRVTVKDVVAPTIALNVKNDVYKVGATVTIADYVAMDESSPQSALEVTCYVICPDGSIKYLSGNSFVVEHRGTYTVYYIVRDEARNNGFAHYVIYAD